MSGVISKVFKMILNHVESVDRKNLSYICFKKFWIIENSFAMAQKANYINIKKNTKRFSTFDFTTLYVTNSHELLVKLLYEIINFVSKSKN